MNQDPWPGLPQGGGDRESAVVCQSARLSILPVGVSISDAPKEERDFLGILSGKPDWSRQNISSVSLTFLTTFFSAAH